MAPIPRPVWVSRIIDLWTTRSIVWLAGARRLGKTELGKQIPETRLFNCDLPSVRRRLDDPETFLAALPTGSRIVLDEIHRLGDPSTLLKIAADEFPGVRILATGSSTLYASAHFRDTLAGRKWPLRLAPVLWRECPGWTGSLDLERRLLHGGFPELLLAARPDPAWFEEWTDSFFARDVAPLFGVRNRGGFVRVARSAITGNGTFLSHSALGRDAGVSRPTVVQYLDILEDCQLISRIPPFHGGGRRELVRKPRLYALDTGLVCQTRGWTDLRPSDRGPLWENLVLDELLTAAPRSCIHVWRDGAGHEVDFVVDGGRDRVIAIEAKLSPDGIRARSLRRFRNAYPDGPTLLCVPFAEDPWTKRVAGFPVTVCAPRHLATLLRSPSP